MINKKYGISAKQIEKYGFKLALEVYEKYNKKCSVCGTQNYLAIHHIDGKGSNYVKLGLKPNNSLDNLQLICRTCHNKIHLKKRWDRQLKEQGGYKFYGREKEYHQSKQFKDKQKEYYQKNKEVIKERSRKYYASHKLLV